MLTRPGRAACVLALAACLGVLGACSGLDPAPPTSTSTGAAPSTPPTASPVEALPAVGDVFRAARTAALAAESARIEGTLQREGKSVEIEVEGLADGSNQELILTAGDNGRSEVLTVGDDYWLGGDKVFWTEQTGDARAGKKMVGMYSSITRSDAEELGSFTLRTILTEKLSEPAISAMEGSVKPVGKGDLDGSPAYVLAGKDGARLWVATDGSATLLRLRGPKAAPCDLRFSSWNRAERATPPAPSDVVDPA